MELVAFSIFLTFREARAVITTLTDRKRKDKQKALGLIAIDDDLLVRLIRSPHV